MDTGTTNTLVTIVLGLVAPFITSFLKNPGFHKNTKVAIAFLVALVLAAAQVLYMQGFLPKEIVEVCLQIFALATLVYKLILEDTPTDEALENTTVLK